MGLGLVCVSTAAMLSGFAGVYFEMVLKSTNGSIWVRNIQLALISLVISSAGCYYSDRNSIYEKGFLFGYDSLVMTVICIGAVGGIVVAIVIKYLDNILKGFASGASIILSCIVSAYVVYDESYMNTMFISGTSLVCLSIVAYATAENPPIPPLSHNAPSTMIHASSHTPLSSKYFPDAEKGLKN